MISVRNVSKSFGRVQAVRNVSLDIRAGEFFSLLGASGSGKTTLLRVIAGFEGVTTGEILIDGQAMQEMPPHLRPINMVFQNYAIFPHLNVRENIAYGLQRLKIGRDQQAAMVDEMLALIALPGYGDRRAHQLSGGQMQRVALARALILKPKVLLLDEPLGALDKQLREQMQLELRGLQRKLGITFVLVTHDQEEALTLSDRVAVMANGEVIQMDTPAALYDNPRNRQVASFVGTMNFFPATVVGSGPAAALSIEGLGHQVVNGLLRERRDGDRVIVAMRPEAFTLHRNAPDVAALPVRFGARQYLGGRQMLHIGINGRDAPIAVAAAAGRGTETWDIAEGGPAWMTWQPDSLTVLDVE